MPDRIFTNDTVLALSAILAALWGGLVGYFRRIDSGMKHSGTSFAIHCAASGIAGLVAWLGCTAAQLPAPVTGVLCGIAGHAGAEAVRLFEGMK